MGGDLMRAVVQREYGGPGTWTIERIEQPTPGRGEVLVEVEAAAIDRGTWHLMHGEPWLARLAFGLRRPRNPVPGRDLAGTVVALGPGTDAFAIGDRVYGTGAGSLAEFTVAPTATLAPMPAGCSAERAAAVPVSGQTALQAVRDVAHVQPGQRVLVTGASGGVGSFVVQVAKAAGAEVTGVCSAAKASAVRSLGADHVLDHRVDDPLAMPADAAARYDVIIDIGGRAPVQRLRRALTRNGVVVLVGGLGGGKLLAGYERAIFGAMRSPFVPQRIAMLASTERRADLERLTPMIESGAVVPLIDQVVPLDRAADAMARLEAGLVTGKLVIRVRMSAPSPTSPTDPPAALHRRAPD